MKASLILCSCPSPEVGREIGRVLVSEGLVACVQVIDSVLSIYRWQDEECEEREVLILMKTANKNYAEAEARIKALHPYDCPEILEVPVGRGEAGYLDWMRKQLCP